MSTEKVEQDVMVETPDKGAKPAESPTAKLDDYSNTQTSGTAKPAEESSGKLPFHKDPEVQAYLNKMLSRKERDWDSRLQSIKDEYTRQLEVLNQSRLDSGKSELAKLPPEQESAIMQLAEYIFGNPAVRQKYGLDEIKSLRDQFQSSMVESQQTAFDAELKSVLDNYAEKYGYGRGELEEDLRDFMANDPWFENKSYHRGSVDKAARLFFSGKEKEMAERETNLKLIKEKEIKKNQTESPSKGQKSPNAVKEKNMNDYLARRVQEEGGLVFD